ncbi:hypothetical protein N8017_04725 [Crocinitomicaceae bacterium]|nr:hypothetical protein [Crocinitomicaceae bacterium]
MDNQKMDRDGCLGLALMVIGGLGCFMGLVTGTGEFWYVGPLLPIGYLMYSG